jgi:hypothetical protein
MKLISARVSDEIHDILYKRYLEFQKQKSTVLTFGEWVGLQVEQIISEKEYKTCTSCNKRKPISEFYGNISCNKSWAGVRGDCKECVSTKGKARYNRDKLKKKQVEEWKETSL